MTARYKAHSFVDGVRAGDAALAGVPGPLCAGVLLPDGPYALGGGRSIVDSPLAAAVMYALQCQYWGWVLYSID